MNIKFACSSKNVFFGLMCFLIPVFVLCYIFNSYFRDEEGQTRLQEYLEVINKDKNMPENETTEWVLYSKSDITSTPTIQTESSSESESIIENGLNITSIAKPDLVLSEAIAPVTKSGSNVADELITRNELVLLERPSISLTTKSSLVLGSDEATKRSTLEKLSTGREANVETNFSASESIPTTHILGKENVLASNASSESVKIPMGNAPTMETVLNTEQASSMENVSIMEHDLTTIIELITQRDFTKRDTSVVNNDSTIETYTLVQSNSVTTGISVTEATITTAAITSNVTIVENASTSEKLSDVTTINSSVRNSLASNLYASSLLITLIIILY